MKNGELTEKGYEQLYKKGKETREYFKSKNLIGNNRSFSEEFVRFITSPVERVKLSLYSFLLGFYEEEFLKKELQDLDLNSGTSIRNQVLHLRDKYINHTDSSPLFPISINPAFTNIAWNNFEVCPAIKEYLIKAETH